MRSISASVSGLNITISSTRLRNSGRKCDCKVRITIERASSLTSPPAVTPSSRYSEPMLEVMISTVLRKSTVRPWESVSGRRRAPGAAC